MTEVTNIAGIDALLKLRIIELVDTSFMDNYVLITAEATALDYVKWATASKYSKQAIQEGALFAIEYYTAEKDASKCIFASRMMIEILDHLNYVDNILES